MTRHQTPAARWPIAARFDRAKANRAAKRFELTREDYDYLSRLHASHLARALGDMVRAFDFDRRPIIGVYGAVSPLGMKAWQDAWFADLDAHMKRGWEAVARAEKRFGRKDAA